jgi:predicted metalloprotease
MGGLPRIGGGAGLVVLAVIVAIQVFGGGGSGGYDLGPILDEFAGGGGGDPSNPQPIPPGQDPQRDLKEFSAYVFDDGQEEWEGLVDRGDYDRAQLVLYDGAVQTGGCGSATSAVGPFYCPGDSRVYLDLSFYEDMERELGGGGDFAWAYVIAHELGHHIQNLVGTDAEVERLTRQDPGRQGDLSVRTELQADCYAGVWARTVFAQGDLEEGDLDEAFNTAEAIGDDRLQRQSTGTVDPDTFTHGTSEQRRRWFDAGYESGDPADCDTFTPSSV